MVQLVMKKATTLNMIQIQYSHCVHHTMRIVHALGPPGFGHIGAGSRCMIVVSICCNTAACDHPYSDKLPRTMKVDSKMFSLHSADHVSDSARHMHEHLHYMKVIARGGDERMC